MLRVQYVVRTLVLVTVSEYNDAMTPALVSMDTLEMTSMHRTTVYVNATVTGCISTSSYCVEAIYGNFAVPVFLKTMAMWANPGQLQETTRD